MSGPASKGLAIGGESSPSVRARRFDLALLMPMSFEAALWAALGGARRRVGFATDGRSVLLTDRVRFDSELARAGIKFTTISIW